MVALVKQYEDLIKSVRNDSVEDLEKLSQFIDFNVNNPEGFAFSVALLISYLYLSRGKFWEILESNREYLLAYTNLRHYEQRREDVVEIFSDAILGNVRLSPLIPPEANVTYFMIALFGENALDYRHTRMALHFIRMIEDRFTYFKEKAERMYFNGWKPEND